MVSSVFGCFFFLAFFSHFGQSRQLRIRRASIFVPISLRHNRLGSLEVDAIIESIEYKRNSEAQTDSSNRFDCTDDGSIYILITMLCSISFLFRS